MRISGGKAKGIQLSVSKAARLRPATEANRERLSLPWVISSTKAELSIFLQEPDPMAWRLLVEELQAFTLWKKIKESPAPSKKT